MAMQTMVRDGHDIQTFKCVYLLTTDTRARMRQKTRLQQYQNCSNRPHNGDGVINLNETNNFGHNDISTERHAKSNS